VNGDEWCGGIVARGRGGSKRAMVAGAGGRVRLATVEKVMHRFLGQLCTGLKP